MSKQIKLKKGFDINLAGKPASNVEEGVKSDEFAIKPPNFLGFKKPKVLVGAGDKVKAGQPLYFDKSAPAIQFASPVSGEVVEVKRGEKRRLLEIVVKADEELEFESFKSYSVSEINNVSADEAKTLMLQAGVWPNIIQRPYAVIANPEDAPKSIFISGFDSSPLAPDYSVIFKGNEDAFKAGVEVLKKFSSNVHLNIDGNAEVNSVFSAASGVQVNKVSGPHPAGNVGVQIHHIDPINKGEIVWTVNPFGVIQIGKLFLEGKYDASRIVAVAGSEVTKPQYYKTYTGAKVKTFLTGNLNSDNVRVISGNVLTGEKITQEGFLGFYDSQVTVIPEGDDLQFFGSFVPDAKRLSVHRAFGLFSFLNPSSKEYSLTSNINGEHRAHVLSGVMEKVLPMDILPVYLLKAIECEDFDEMEALGIYEVAEEDFALCEFVDVSKHDVQKIVRQGLELMQNS